MKRVSTIDYENYLDKWEKQLDDQYEKDLKIYGHREAMRRFQYGMAQLQNFSYAAYRDMVLGEV